MDILNLSSTVEDTYYSPAFMKVIEDHLTYLRNGNVTVIQLTNTQCVKYIGDFFGLLIDLKIDKNYHYAVMRVNNYLSAADYKGDISQVIVPDLPEIDLLKNVFET